MKRLFFSLYFFIVLSLVLLTAALDTLVLSQKSTFTDAQQGWINLISAYQSSPEELKLLLENAGLDYSEMMKESLATSEQVSTQLNNMEIITNFNQEQWQLIVPLPESKLLSIDFTDQAVSPSSWWLYSSLFFILLAALVAIWIYPLWRDLTRLIEATKEINNDGSFEIPSFNHRSPVRGVAEALKELRLNVSTLVKTQRELTSAITHEFKTPLARLKFALADTKQLSDEKLSAIHQDIDDIDHLVQEMLDYTKLNIQSPELHMECIPLKDLCASRVEVFQKNTDKQISISGDAPDLIADGHLISRAIDNLLSNAIKYAKKDIQLMIKADKSDILVHVEDDGVGLEPLHYSKIFEPFYTVHYTQAESKPAHAKSSGLGLAIVSRVMQWHQGKCEISSSLLGGAKFTLIFNNVDTN